MGTATPAAFPAFSRLPHPCGWVLTSALEHEVGQCFHLLRFAPSSLPRHGPWALATRWHEPLQPRPQLVLAARGGDVQGGTLLGPVL